MRSTEVEAPRSPASQPAAVRFDADRREDPPRDFHHDDRLQTLTLDAAALAADLRRELKGEVRFDDAARAIYSTDASNYRQVPIGVVMPIDVRSEEHTSELQSRFD